MGTGWRRAFCNTMPREKRSESSNMEKPSPRFTRSEPTTPRLSCKTNNIIVENGVNNVNLVSPSPRLQCKTTPKSQSKSPRNFLGSSTPSSPRSPFSLLKNALRLSRNGCGVCMQSMKSGQGMAIYTAECSHAFHFPCISSHVRDQNSLICPVCSTTWKDFPLLAVHKQNHNQESRFKEPEIQKTGVDSSPKYYTKVHQVDSKSYSDDEPLNTPRSCSKFVPIPETKETDDDMEEFKGFFINSVPNDTSSTNSRNVDFTLLPEAAVISIGRTHDTFAVVLKVKAHIARRAPIDLVTVLDVGGSMHGPKLEMLKRAMRLVISSLTSTDRLSIVVFSSISERLLPLTRMTHQGQRSAFAIVDNLSCSQGTCMGEALKHATKVLQERCERNPVASIILLSGGEDNESVPHHSSKQNQSPNPTHSSTRFAHVEIPVNAPNAFTKCVGELLSVVVQDLRIQIGFAPGSDPAEIMAVYSCNGQYNVFGPGCVRVGDLYAEEERELMVEIRVPKRKSQHYVFAVKSCFKDPGSEEVFYGKERMLLVPQVHADRSGKIERLRCCFIMTRAIGEARRLMEYGELSSALALLSSARDLLIQSRSEFVGEFIRGLEGVIAEVMWQRQCMRRRMGEESGGKLSRKGSFSRVGGDLHGFENARF